MYSEPKQISLEHELVELRLENAELKRKLAQKNEEKEAEKVVLSPALRGNDLSPWKLSMKVQEWVSKKGFLESFQNSKPENNSREVQPKKDIEWWTLVNRAKPKKLEDNLEHTHEIGLLDGPYMLINERDVVESVAIFIAQCLFSNLECDGVSADELRKRIDGSFQELHGKGMMLKAWDWASFLHSASSWTITAFEIYSDPGMVKLLVSSILNTATWIGLGTKLSSTAMSIILVLGQRITALQKGILKLF